LFKSPKGAGIHAGNQSNPSRIEARKHDLRGICLSKPEKENGLLEKGSQ
jgi:hypothetical protein